MLDRQRCEVGIRNEIALRGRRMAEPCEDLPMMRASRDRDTVRLFAQLFRESDRIDPRARHLEHARMGDDAQESAHDELTESVGRVRVDLRLEPRPHLDMMR